MVTFGAKGRDGEATRSSAGDRGDGLLLIVPPDVPTAQVIERLVTVLPAMLKRHNRAYND